MGRNKLAHLPAVRRELGDAIGAEAVDSKGIERFPVTRLVGGPRDDSRADRVRSLDDFLVDRIDFLPEVFRGSGGKGSDRIDVPRDLEHARADCREDVFHDLDDAVVERVHGAGRFRFANASSNQGLDILRLDLDVHRRPASNRLERFRKGRNAHTVSERESLEFRGRDFSDRPMRGPLWMPGVDDWIVVNHDDPVASRVHVELNAIGSQLDGALKGGDRVLGMSLVRPTV